MHNRLMSDYRKLYALVAVALAFGVIGVPLAILAFLFF